MQNGAKQSKNNRKRVCKFPPWWDTDCDKVKASRKNATDVYLKNCSEENFNELKKAEENAKKTFLQKKRSFRQNFHKEINPTKNINNIWKSIKALKAYKNAPINVPQVSIDDEKIQLAIKKISDPPLIKNPTLCTPSKITYDNLITKSEYNFALSKLKVKSAPGSDCISNEIILSLSTNTHDLILSIFNDFYASGLYPDSWRNYTVILIPKPHGKGYRPI